MHAVILCNGRPPDFTDLSRNLESADLFIAADGGANLALDLQLTPDIITGDLDSYRRIDPLPEGVEIVKDPDQETNDLEKALKLAAERGVQSVDIYGAFGQRIDHTLKNLSVLKQYSNKFSSIRFLDRFGTLFLLPPTFTLESEPGTTISLIPLSSRVTGITTSGLEYPLKSESLEFGVRDGTSNRAIRDRITITHEGGDLLIYIASGLEEA